MKKLILLALFTVSLSFSQVTSQNSMGLSRWVAGNKLNAGTIGDTAIANASLNRNFDLISALWLRQHNNKGWFTSLYGDSTANLIIGLAGSQHNRRVVFNDSVYLYYNLFSEGSAVFGGNVTVGGYMSLDSILVASKLFVPDTITALQVTASDLRGTNYVVTRGYFQAGFASSQNGQVILLNENNALTATLQASTIASSSKTLELPNVTGTIATIDGNQNFTNMGTIASENITVTGKITADSIQSTTIHAVLFNSEKVATATLNDTSALFVDWQANTTTEYPIVRLKYLHKAGITSIKARYYAYIAGGGDNWESLTTVGSLSSSTTTGSNTSYSAMSTTTLTVSGLTANTLYDLQFKIGTNTLGTSHFKELVITAESN